MDGWLFNACGQTFDYCVAYVWFGYLIHKAESAKFVELDWLFLRLPSILLILQLINAYLL